MKVDYGKGWSQEEADDIGPFRWMGQEASVLVKGVRNEGRKYLRIVAGHSFSERPSPCITVTANGEEIGQVSIESSFSSYSFPVDLTDDISIHMKLDSVFRVEGDPRPLGIMIREIDFVDGSSSCLFLDGWYEPEVNTEEFSADPRWMKERANSLLAGLEKGHRYLLKLRGGHPYPETRKNPVLTVATSGKSVGELSIRPGMSEYVIPLDVTESRMLLDLSLDQRFPKEMTRDSRTLGLQIEDLEIIDMDVSSSVEFGEGWYIWEFDEFLPFHWMSDEAVIYIPPRPMKKNRYMGFYAFSEYMDYSQVLSVYLGDQLLEEIPLQYRWNYYCLPIKPSSEFVFDEKKIFKIRLVLNKPYPQRYYSQDGRILGVRMGEIALHDKDSERDNFLAYHNNALLNHREMMGGKTELDSFPLNLGIDLYGKCNISPPCVYCLWHSMKELEGEYTNENVDESTLEKYGPFFKSARTLVNCSFGEPLLHPRFEQILDYCDDHKKIMEISTNGQAFTQRTIKALAGKPIYLYISLDAATGETYAKIRNDRWEEIVPNLTLLNEERKKKGNLPKIFMVFMPMHVNRNDLEAYFQLCQKIEADALVLRPLLYLYDPKIEIDRGGYHFDYKKELLPRETLEEIFEECNILAKKYGVQVANQFNFGATQEPGETSEGSSGFEWQRS